MTSQSELLPETQAAGIGMWSGKARSGFWVKAAIASEVLKKTVPQIPPGGGGWTWGWVSLAVAKKGNQN